MAIWGEFIFQFLRFEKFDYNSDNERIIGNLIAKEPSLCNQNWIMYGSFVRTPGRP